MTANLDFIKTIIKILKQFLIALVIFALVVLLLLQFGKTQLFIAEKVFDFLEEKYQVTFQVDAIKISPFGGVRVQHILIKDHHQDTLIYIQDLKTKVVNPQSFKNKQLFFNNTIIKKGYLNDCIYPDEEVSSFKVFTSKFTTQKKSLKPLVLNFKNLHSENLRYLRHTSVKKIVDFQNISGSVQSLLVHGADIEAEIDSLSFKDIYGVDYQKLAASFKYSLTQMSFVNTQIKTTHSNLLGNVTFDYEPGDFSSFVEKVKITSDLRKSTISLEDVNKIYPHINGKEVFNLNSDLSGTLNDLSLKKTELISTDYTTYLIGDFKLQNSIKNRDAFNFKAAGASIEIIPGNLTNFIPNQYHVSLPKSYYGLKQLNYIGDFSVSRSKLELNGQAITNLGRTMLKGDLDHLNTDRKSVNIQFVDGFIPENVLHKDLKKTKFKGNVTGVMSPNHLDLSSNINFKEIGYKKNSIKNSSLTLKWTQDAIKSTFESKDSLMSLMAKVDYLKKGSAKHYQLGFKIKQLKLSKLFPEYVSYQKNIIASGELEIIQEKDSLLSYASIDELQIDTGKEFLNLNKVNLNVSSKKDEKKMTLASKDLLDLSVSGNFEFSDLEKLIENALYKFIPGKKERKNVKDQTLYFDMNVYPKFVKSLTSKINLEDNLRMSGILNAKNDIGVIKINGPLISSKDFEVDSLKIVLDNSNQWINTNISVNKFRFKKQVYNDLSLLGKKVNDTLFVRSNFKSEKINNRAVFYLTTLNDYVSLGIDNLYLEYLNSIWTNKENKENKVDYNYKTGEWNFYDISFGNKDQEFDFEGNIKKNKSKNLKLELRNIKIDDVLPKIDSLNIEGIASGKVYFNEKNNLLKPSGDLFIKDLKINEVAYGNMATSIKPNRKDMGYDINFNIYNDSINSVGASGEIVIDKKYFRSSKLDLKVVLNDLKLNSLSPLGRNVLSSIRGTAQGNIDVKGTLNDLNSYGFINLNKAGLKFPYLNTDYNFSDNTRINVDGKSFVFSNVELEDNVHQTHGILSGNINYDKFKDWNLDLKLATRNLLVLNTEFQESTSYYGTAFMRGNATIKGATSALDINVIGTTLPNTTFVLPLSDVKKAEKNKFIVYKQQTEDVEESNDKKKEVVNDQGLHISLNIGVTKDAFGEIVIDQSSGSSLQARADGRLLVDIDKFFNIKMYGDLVLDEGMYIYKYGKIINKPFVVTKGGTVSWSGDPYKANLNIQAVHNLKANPKVLLESLSTSRKIDVNLITKVTGELFDSNQEFLIEIPNASSTVASELDFKLNIDQNTKMRQFFSLLASKSFYDENNTNGTGAVISSTTSELISNAITEIFNNGDSKLQVNIGYTAGEDSSVEDLTVDNQIDIGLQTEINDRVLINGSLGLPVGATTQSTVVGEVKIEFLINKDGTLRSSVFNRQNEIQYSEEEEGYTQGVGLSYQIDFNNLSEMLQEIGLKRKKKKKIKKKGEVSQKLEDNLIYILPTLP